VHPTNTGITRKNDIVEYLDHQIPVTQLKGPKGNGDASSKAMLKRPNYPRSKYMVMWAVDKLKR